MYVHNTDRNTRPMERTCWQQGCCCRFPTRRSPTKQSEMFTGRVVLTLASLCAVSLVGHAQTTEGARIFNATSTTQTVKVQQNGSGAGLTSTTPSTGAVGAVFGQATATSGQARGVWGVSNS